MRARALTAVGIAAASVITLTGCEKPAPSVTVWSGTTSERESALCWSFDADDELDAQACLEGAAENAGEISVVPGQRIGISVDAAVAADGWFPTIGESRLTAEPIETTYFGFAVGEGDLQEGPLELRVVALDDAGEGRGIWAFRIVRA